MKKRLLSLLLALTMLLSMLPVQALAEGEPEASPESTAATQASTVPETVPPEPTVPETTAAPTVPETAAETEPADPEIPEETVPEITEETVPVTTEETVPETTEETIPELDEISAFSEGESCGEDLYWKVEGNVLTICPGSDGGDMLDYTDKNPAPWKEFADQITTVNMEGGTAIGANAFAGLTHVTTVNLPKTLMRFTGSFAECTSLETFDFPSGNANGYSVASGGKAIVRENLRKTNLCAVAPTVSGEYTVPETVTAIYYGAFSGCSKISKIIFPKGLTEICNEAGAGAFVGCTSLTELVFQSRLPAFHEGVFTGLGDITVYFVPYNVDGDIAESQTFGARSITWCPQYPQSDATGGSCGENLYWKVEDNTLTIYAENGIGGEMLYYTAKNPAPWAQYADQITAINMEGGITIGVNAFAGLKNVTTVNLPKTLMYVSSAFTGCTSLTAFIFPDGNDYGYSVVDGKTIVRAEGKETVLYAVAPSVSGGYTVPETVTHINYGAFNGCSQITGITFPAGLNYISGSAIAPTFTGCGAKELVFTGSAPSLEEEGAFTGLGAVTVTYPGNLDGWIEVAKMDNLGAEVTWNNTYRVTMDAANPTEANAGSAITLKASVSGSTVKWRLDGDTYNENHEVNGTGDTVSYAAVDAKTGKLTVMKGFTMPVWVRVIAEEANGKAEPAEAYIKLNPVADTIVMLVDGEEPEDGEYVVNLMEGTGEEIAFTVSASVFPASAPQNLKWKISDTKGTYVSTEETTDADGNPGYRFTPTGKTGTVTVTVSTNDGSGKSAKLTVRIVKAPTSIVIENLPTYEEYEGQNLIRGGGKVVLRTNVASDKTFTDKTVVWSLDDAATPYASINPTNGTLTTYPVANWQTITVYACLKSDPTVRGELEITITPTAHQVYIDFGGFVEEFSNRSGSEKPGTAFGTGGTTTRGFDGMDASRGAFYVYAGFQPDDAIPYGKWSISGKAAELEPLPDGSALITPKGAGKVTITFTTTDGSRSKAVLDLYFYADPNYLQITSPVAAPVLKPGDTLKLSATAFADEACTIPAENQEIEWLVATDVKFSENGSLSWYDYPGASISSKGVLTVKQVTEPTTVTVIANIWGAHDTFEVTLLPKTEKTLVLSDGYDLLNNLYLRPGESLHVMPFWYDYSQETDDLQDKLEHIGDDEKCTVTSSKPSVARYIREDGYLEALRAGTTTITAKCGGQTYSFQLTVEYSVDRTEITQNPATLIGGQSATLKATNWCMDYDWTWDEESQDWTLTDAEKHCQSTDQKVSWYLIDDEYEGEIHEYDCTETEYAKIDTKTGRLTAKTVSENVTVTVRAYGNGYDAQLNDRTQATCEITIRPKADIRSTMCYYDDPVTGTVNNPVNFSRVLSKADFTINVYDAVQGKSYTVQPEDITWTSKNPKVAYIAESAGAVDGYPYAAGDLVFTGALGTTVLTATATLTTEDGRVIPVTATVTIKAINGVEGITVSRKKEGEKLYAGKSVSLKAEIANANATNKKVTWHIAECYDGKVDRDTLDNCAFATVSSSGVVKVSKESYYQQEYAVWAQAADLGEWSDWSDPIFLTAYPQAAVVNIVSSDRKDFVLDHMVLDGAYLGTAEVTARVYSACGYLEPDQTVKWTSSNKAVAEVTVDPDTGIATITTRKKGSATITAATVDGSKVSASFKINCNGEEPQP